MAEVAGLVIGGVGLAAMFDVCMNAFDRVESGKAYGKDYQEAALSLRTLQLRLARWRETVEIVEDSSQANYGVPVASQAQAELLGDLLGSIEGKFKDAEKAGKLHKFKNPTAPPPPADGSWTINALEEKVQTMSLERQKKTSVAQKTRWVLHDKKFFSEVIATLTRQIKDVEELFPANQYPVQQTALTKYVQQDGNALTKATQELVPPSEVEEPEVAAAALLKATAQVDPQLKEVLNQIVQNKTGHTYGNLTLTDQAKALRGTFVASDYDGPRDIKGHQNKYGDTHASDQTKVHEGDVYGGRYILDD
ncbi:Hypothetical predicted protein [Lecanosticta acicola]|uniref:Prion-inhibition and propagation HeLo domain-containing protein n=1 Tax=Lecanosticta acicola TaxID=111012 RepID=A0AAI8YSF4_9PEZI|nr:Hypothetical predicted protein [Lecanosticta acicola]